MGGRGAIRLALAFATLLASLTLVVWRQSRALKELQSLDRIRSERALLESERADLTRKIETLESRAHIVAVAGERFGLRVPKAAEIVLLPIPPAGHSADRSLVAAARGSGGGLHAGTRMAGAQ